MKISYLKLKLVSFNNTSTILASNMKKKNWLFTLLSLLPGFLLMVANAGDTIFPILKMAGGTAWLQVLTPIKIKEIEKVCKVKLEIYNIGSAHGIQKLTIDQVQIALVTGEFETSVTQAVQKHFARVKPSDLNYTLISKGKIVFAVHKENPIQKVTSNQLRGLLAGYIKNWKEIGGKDIPVQVILPGSKRGSSRFEVQKQILDGKSFASTAKEVEKARDISGALVTHHGGIGAMGSKHADERVKILNVGSSITIQFGLATKGKLNPQQKCFFDNVKESET